MGRLILPYINPINLVEVSPTLIPQYVSRFMDDYLWANRLSVRQSGVSKYYQPWNNNDVVSVQFQNSAGQVVVYLVNCKGKKIDSFIATPKQQNKYQPEYFIYESHIALTPYPEGHYFFIYEIGSPVRKALISEPIYIKPQHEGTILFQYKHRTFRGNMVFETGIQPSVRVKANLKKQVPKSKDTLYEDQVLDMTILKSTPFRVFDLTLEQIPDWYGEIFNWIMGCSDVRLDGRYYTKNGDDAKFEKEVSAYFDALIDHKLELRESVNRNSKIFDVDEDTTEEFFLTLNVDSKGFADTSQNASSSVITFIDVE
jgi:hypothetical protein